MSREETRTEDARVSRLARISNGARVVLRRMPFTTKTRLQGPSRYPSIGFIIVDVKWRLRPE